MAEINTTELEALKTRTQDDIQGNEALSTIDYTPSMRMLQHGARSMGAFDLEATIGRFDPERITMKQRSQMRRDPMIALGLHFRKATIINAPWHMECDDPQVAAFATWALDRIYTRLVSQMFMALEWGYVPIIKRFGRAVPGITYEDPESNTTRELWPNKDIPAVTWKPFFPMTPEGAEVIFDQPGRTFAGFKHVLLRKPDGSTNPVKVPASHALWVTNMRDENFGDWYGYPLTGYAFRYWWSYWYQFLLADRHMEQDADPPVKASYPPGSSPDPTNPTATLPNAQIALLAGQMIRDGSTVAVPSDFYEIDATGALSRGSRKWDIEFIRGGENIKAFHDSFQYLDVMKLRSMLIPDQALTGARGSLSGNVAETYSVAFAESQALIASWIDQHINDYMIPDLLAQNFVNPPECRKVSERFREQDVALANRVIEIVAAADPSALELNLRKIVQSFNLPTLTQEEVERQKAEKAAEAAAAEPLNEPPSNILNDGKANDQRTSAKNARDTGAGG